MRGERRRRTHSEGEEAQKDSFGERRGEKRLIVRGKRRRKTHSEGEEAQKDFSEREEAQKDSF